MSPRIVIAALSVAMMGVVSPSFAQSPETSAAAMAAPKAKSEKASSPAEAGKVSNTGTSKSFTVGRSANNTGAGKTAAQPSAKN